MFFQLIHINLINTVGGSTVMLFCGQEKETTFDVKIKICGE